MAKRKIEAVQINDLNVSIETKKIDTKDAPIGRPRKFIKKRDKTVNMYFTEGQIEAIDKKVAEIGFSARTDYFRKLFRADIKDFDEL